MASMRFKWYCSLLLIAKRTEPLTCWHKGGSGNFKINLTRTYWTHRTVVQISPASCVPVPPYDRQVWHSQPGSSDSGMAYHGFQRYTLLPQVSPPSWCDFKWWLNENLANKYIQQHTCLCYHHRRQIEPAQYLPPGPPPFRPYSITSLRHRHHNLACRSLLQF